MQWRSISCQYLRTAMMRFEAGPEDGPRCPDGGALKAYKCSADKWTIAFGVRWHPDGRPVVEGDTITPEQVWEYTDAAVARVEEDIRSVVTVDMTPWQYAGVVFWVYNLGIGALKKTVDGESQLLPKINAGRWLDAAAAMGVFVYATTTKGDHAWKRALFGLFIRRCAEGCLLMGCDWEAACDSERLSLPTRTDWQPTLSRYYDVVLEGKTPFLNVYRDAKAYPLTQAEPPVATTAASAGPQARLPNPAPVAPAPVSKPVAPASPSVAAGPVAGGSSTAAPQPSHPLPVPLPKRPDPPIPIGQQTSAVDAARKSEEWSSNTKAMWQSRRFYGLVLIMAGRLWMLKTGSNAFLGAVSDPLVMEFVGGFCVMVAGELVQAWGRKKATRALH